MGFLYQLVCLMLYIKNDVRIGSKSRVVYAISRCFFGNKISLKGLFIYLFLCLISSKSFIVRLNTDWFLKKQKLVF